MENILKTALTEALRRLIVPGQTKENVILAYHYIKSGADPNTKSLVSNYTILRLVVELNDIPLLEQFIQDAKCSFTIRDKNGYLPIDYAIDGRLPKIVDWFFENGIEMSRCKKLHQICSAKFDPKILNDGNNLLEVVKVFVKRGVNLLEPSRDYYKRLPYQLALESNNNDSTNPLVIYLKQETDKQMLKTMSFKRKAEGKTDDKSIQPDQENMLKKLKSEKRKLEETINKLKAENERLQKQC